MAHNCVLGRTNYCITGGKNRLLYHHLRPVFSVAQKAVSNRFSSFARERRPAVCDSKQANVSKSRLLALPQFAVLHDNKCFLCATFINQFRQFAASLSAANSKHNTPRPNHPVVKAKLSSVALGIVGTKRVHCLAAEDR